MITNLIAFVLPLAALGLLGWGVFSIIRAGGVARFDCVALWLGIALDAGGMVAALVSAGLRASGYLLPAVVALAAMAALAGLATRAYVDGDRVLGRKVAQWAWAPMAVWLVVFVFRIILGLFIVSGAVNLQ